MQKSGRERHLRGAPALIHFNVTFRKPGLFVNPGIRPRFAIGLPSISFRSPVKSIGGAALIALPTP